jgi:hypothetical protein
MCFIVRFIYLFVGGDHRCKGIIYYLRTGAVWLPMCLAQAVLIGLNLSVNPNLIHSNGHLKLIITASRVLVVPPETC